MVDIGLTHVALQCRDVDASIAFYARYADMRVVHRRHDSHSGHDVVWLGDGTRPFVIVLIASARVEGVLGPIAHLGVGCASREEVDRRAAAARAAGVRVMGPEDHGYPVGYYAFLHDPDGHALELSHGQEVGLVARGAATAVPK